VISKTVPQLNLHIVLSAMWLYQECRLFFA